MVFVTQHEACSRLTVGRHPEAPSAGLPRPPGDRTASSASPRRSIVTGVPKPVSARCAQHAAPPSRRPESDRRSCWHIRGAFPCSSASRDCGPGLRMKPRRSRYLTRRAVRSSCQPLQFADRKTQRQARSDGNPALRSDIARHYRRRSVPRRTPHGAVAFHPWHRRR